MASGPDGLFGGDSIAERIIFPGSPDKGNGMLPDHPQAQMVTGTEGPPTGGKHVAMPLSSSNKKVGYRRGKWTMEEEAYANRLIQEFKHGMLPLTDGTTLRTFLSKLLNCDPMRISKKFVGQNCIGKQVFRRRQQELDKLTEDQLMKTRQELSELERVFLERVAQTNRSQRTSAGVVKNGRLSYIVGEGPPPWMMPPDEPAGEHRVNAEVMLNGMTSDALMNGGLASALSGGTSGTLNTLTKGLYRTRSDVGGIQEGIQMPKGCVQ